MITPTAREPVTAPGLLNFKRSHGTPNSSRRMSAKHSASDSTKPKFDSPTNAIKRFDHCDFGAKGLIEACKLHTNCAGTHNQ